MPRLLLVDDNPSIHRIAESLLAPTDVELVCVDSAAEALDRIERGERFDVALVDTAMPGMDGWTLLSRLRAMDETARMPIALMAGVLDPVDPSKLAKAPIQGFLKKPIELRELGDRVKALLVATVPPPGISPFSTVPATSARDLVQRAEASLPELRPEPEPAAASDLDVPEFAMDEVFTHDELLAKDAADLLAPAFEAPLEEDILVLTAEDLWPEEAAPVAETALPAAPVVADVHLELEELDLDSLQDLTASPLSDLSVAEAYEPAAPAAPATHEAPEPAQPALEEDREVTLSGLEELDTFPAGALSADALTAPDFLPEPEPKPESKPELQPEHGHAIGIGEAIGMPLAGAAVVALAGAALTGAGSETPTSALEPDAPSAAGGQTPAVTGHAPLPNAGSVSSDQAQVLVQALLADPVLVDALVKAVVARMGDQVLREIAWEVMPDLAGRLQR